MDLLDFNGEDLYFDEPLADEVVVLLHQASESYGSPEAEHKLLQAYFREPENYTVLVALYRYYYYQHRYEDALMVADRTLGIAAARLGISRDWHQIGETDLAYGVQHSMALMRFYLHALKGAGYLNLRLGQYQEALERLQKVVELDVSDRIGAAALRDLALESLGGQIKTSVAA